MMLGGVNPVSRWRGTPIIFGGSASCGRPVPNQHAGRGPHLGCRYSCDHVASVLPARTLTGKVKTSGTVCFLGCPSQGKLWFCCQRRWLRAPRPRRLIIPPPDAEKVGAAPRPGEASSRRMQPSSTGRLAPVVNIACFAREVMSGPGCQESQVIHTANRDASILPLCNGSEIAWRAGSLISTGSGSRTCTQARGWRINRPKITRQRVASFMSIRTS